MGGKKKKSLANKLSKMSDEERARYLQHRAEIEEEARRRKEQLIATFMKKKIKKEEAFSRLNMAKINQNWHQILRKMKVKEMKEEVEYLRKWIERVVKNKNRRISQLLDELEEAEEQYLNNFNSHSTHLDNIIENQNEYIEKLQSQYKEELDETLAQARKEERSIKEQANTEIAYLKTVTYAQKTHAAKQFRDNWEFYSKQLFEIEYNNREALRHLRKTRGETETALWRQILQVVRSYVQKTDARRSHFQELRRLDAENAEEIRRNEEKITKDEELIKILNGNYEELLKLKSEQEKSLETEEGLLKNKFFKIRKTLKNQLALDEKQLQLLTATSSETLDDLTHIYTKGNRLLNLSETCQKLETEREKVTKWLPVADLGDICKSSSSSEKEDGDLEEIVKDSGLTDDEKLLKQALEKELQLSKIKDSLPSDEFVCGSKQKSRPKTSLPSKSSLSSATVLDAAGEDFLATPDSAYTPIEQLSIEVEKQEDQEDIESTKKSTKAKGNFLDKCCESLEKLENFWFVYNKTKVDVMDLKQEKTALEKENKQLRGLIRGVLEAVALAKNVTSSSVSTRVSSKRRSAYSAPLRRIVFS